MTCGARAASVHGVWGATEPVSLLTSPQPGSEAGPIVHLLLLPLGSFPQPGSSLLQTSVQSTAA